VATYRYNGLGRRIQKIDRTGASDVTCDYYYNTGWQVLEVRRNADTDPYKQYVWDLRYIDAPVLRWHDANGDGDFLDTDETLYYTNDANMNVTALLDTGGSNRRQTIDMGKVTFDKPGTYDVTLHPSEAGPWKAVNVWQIQLAPAGP